MGDRRLCTRTIAKVEMHIQDDQPYDASLTFEAIASRAREHARKTIACLNRADMRIVSEHSLRLLVIEEYDNG